MKTFLLLMGVITLSSGTIDWLAEMLTRVEPYVTVFVILWILSLAFAMRSTSNKEND